MLAPHPEPICDPATAYNNSSISLLHIQISAHSPFGHQALQHLQTMLFGMHFLPMKSMALFSPSSLPTHSSLSLPLGLFSPVGVAMCLPLPIWLHTTHSLLVISSTPFLPSRVISVPSLSRCPEFLLPPLHCPRCNTVEASLMSSFHTFIYLDNTSQTISLLLESLCQVSICNKKSLNLPACTWKPFMAWLQPAFQPHF